MCYLNAVWGARIDDQTMVAIREHAERLELPITGASAESGEQIRAAMARIPAPRSRARLSDAQLRQLPELFAAGPAAHGFGGRLWDEESSAQVLKRVFGLELDTREAELSALGRKLAGVDPW